MLLTAETDKIGKLLLNADFAVVAGERTVLATRVVNRDRFPARGRVLEWSAFAELGALNGLARVTQRLAIDEFVSELTRRERVARQVPFGDAEAVFVTVRAGPVHGVV